VLGLERFALLPADATMFEMRFNECGLIRCEFAVDKSAQGVLNLAALIT